MSKSKSSIGVLAALGIVLAASTAFSAEVTLTSVTALQQTNQLAKSFLINFRDAVNREGKSVAQVKYLGGQEIVPPRGAYRALQVGQFDLLSCPTAYYIGTVPEGYGLLASNQGPRVLRQNGGFELLQKIYKEKAKAHLLAWGENMTSYYMYLAIQPKMRPDGMPDLTGVKMRATGTYRPLFRALGASTINIKTSEVYTAIQRGTVQGYGFTDIALVAIGLAPVTKYRVKPNFYQTNQVLTVNLDKWASLSKAQKDLLNKVAVEYETTSVEYLEKERLKEEPLVAKAGVKDLVLEPAAAAKYLELAHGEIWKELKKRSKYHDQLRPLLYVPGKPNRQIEIGQKLDEKR